MENSSDILKQVRRIEIKTRGLSNDVFAGKYHSAFKGRGMAFSEVREYPMCAISTGTLPPEAVNPISRFLRRNGS